MQYLENQRRIREAELRFRMLAENVIMSSGC
jgi:hypothetical protein